MREHYKKNTMIVVMMMIKWYNNACIDNEKHVYSPRQNASRIFHASNYERSTVKILLCISGNLGMW